MIFYLSTIANLSTILARVVVLARRMVLIWHLINFESGYLCTFQLANLCVASHSAYDNPRRGLRLSVQDWHSQQHSQCPAKAGQNGNDDEQYYVVRKFMPRKAFST